MFVEKIPDRRWTGGYRTFRFKRLGDFAQADIRLLSDQAENKVLMIIQFRSRRLALLARLYLPRLKIAPVPHPRRRFAYPVSLRRLARGKTALNAPDNPYP